MLNHSVIPISWSVDELVSYGQDAIYELACQAAGSLTSCRLLLGRCLLAVDRTKLHDLFGMSSSIHFAMASLGLSRKEAFTVRRVARELQRLPLLTQAAERGTVSWSKLREVVAVATVETEELWLELCKSFRCGEIGRLVSLTPKGGVPGQLPSGRGPHGSEYRCRFSAETVTIIERVLQQRSQIEGRPLSFAEAVEQLFTEALTRRPFEETADKARTEAALEHQAEQLHRVPLVAKAREIAEELGLAGGVEEIAEVGSDGLAGWAEEITEVGSDGLAGWAEEITEDVREVELEKALESSHVGPKQPFRLLDQALGRLRFNPDGRRTTAAQRKALLRRDRYCCQTPGCSNHLWLHLHHLKWYSQDGKTLPDNLITLCSTCHKNVHEGRLTITGSIAEGLVFTNAEGRRLDRLHRFERATWLDYFIGWRGEEWDCYKMRAA